MSTAQSRRKATSRPQYESVLDLPPLTPEQYEGLRDSIAVQGVLVPILVDGDGPVRRIIDGNHRKQIADELGVECPEIVRRGLTENDLRAMARALNLARRQLDQVQKRMIIADQLRETPRRSNRWVARQLGVHHATVASVRSTMEGTGQIIQCETRLGSDNRVQPAHRPTAVMGPARTNGPAHPGPTSTGSTSEPTSTDHRIRYNPKPAPIVLRTKDDRKARIEAATLIHGDCREAIRSLPDASVDAVITDPIYPEVRREYGKISESDWHDLMRTVVAECRRVLKPKGSAVFIIHPNFEKFGRMRVWPWEFVAWAGREWNLVQDAYWWSIDAMSLAGTDRRVGLMRSSVKMCVWLGPPDCYRNQDRVLWTPSQASSARNRADYALRSGPSGRTFRPATISGAADERGGTTPFNLLPASTGGQPGGTEGHPAPTPYDVAAWWCRYILPTNGVLLDPFVGSGTMLMAGLDEGASKVIGIDREAKYLETARRRIASS
jgi:hypothetical protein